MSGWRVHCRWIAVCLRDSVHRNIASQDARSTRVTVGQPRSLDLSRTLNALPVAWPHQWPPVRLMTDRSIALFDDLLLSSCWMDNTGLTTFLETWKCQGTWLRSGKSQDNSPKSGKGQGICVVMEIWLWQLKQYLIWIHVLYSYFNSFFIRDVHWEFGLKNVHLFDIWPAVSSGKIRDLSVWRLVTLNTQYIVIVLKVLLMKQSIMDCQPLCVHFHKMHSVVCL